MDEKRYSLRAASRTILRTAGASWSSSPRPSGVGQELLGQRRDEELRMRQAMPAPDPRRLERASRRARTPDGVDRFSGLHRAPARRPRRSSRARSRSDPSACGSSRSGFARCSSIRSRTVALAPFALSSSAGTFGGGGGGGAPSMFSRIHLPRMTGDVRLAIRRHRQDAALPSRPPRGLSGRASRAGSGCRRRSGCRSASPAARSRTCSPPSSRSSTLRSSRTMLSKNSSVSRRNACRRLSSKSGNRPQSGVTTSRFRRCSHWPAKFVDERSRPRIGEHAPHLLLEHRRARAARPAPPASSSSSSGMLLQRKNDRRDASSRSLMRIHAARGRHCAGSRSMRNRNSGSTRTARRRHFDAGVEPLAAFAVAKN